MDHGYCPVDSEIEFVGYTDHGADGLVRLNTYEVFSRKGIPIKFHEIIYSQHFARAVGEPYPQKVTYDKRDLYEQDEKLTRYAIWSSRLLKKSLLNWGMADAVIYLNENRGKAIRNGIRSALVSIGHRANSGNGRYVFISSSLGSKIFFDTIAEDIKDPSSRFQEKGGGGVDMAAFVQEEYGLNEADVWSMHAIARQIDTIFLFANQIALLELGSPTVKDFMSQAVFADRKIKLVAFSQRSDLLTFQVTPLIEQYEGGAGGHLLGFDYVVNNRTPLPSGSIIWSISAHAGHHKNPRIMDVIVRGMPPQPSGRHPYLKENE